MSPQLPPQQLIDWIAQTAASQRDQAEQALSAILFQLLQFCLGRLNQHVGNATGLLVQNGPFAGMRCLAEAADKPGFMPKLIGCYESELHSMLTQFARRGYDRIINLGCEDGFYAVGLSRLLPRTPVFAFDADATNQALCRQLAAVNGVGDRVMVGGQCGAAEIQTLIVPNTLLFCDIEGAERQMLDPAIIPGLTGCDILVEIHEFLDPALPGLIRDRFRPTHEITMIPQSGRNPSAWPLLRTMSQFDQFLGVYEGRPGATPWAFLSPRSAS